ncbi:MAG TPA: hypothetical protein PK992_15945, partial [Planctomycetaceae bacterium]|nr:hypothetical protein [Planctomycetaceae bacterium]
TMTLFRVRIWFPGLLVLGVISCVATSGCGSGGPPRVQISGKVTLDGAPLDSGSISFIPEEGVVGPMAGGEITPGGMYLIQATAGPTTGPHRVEIKAWQASGEHEVVGVGGSTVGPSAGGAVATSKMIIPSRYNAKSELSVQIEPGENAHDFTLKSEP